MASATFSERISRLRPSVVREILAVAQTPGVISFAGGLPAPETLPTLSALDVPPELGQYGPSEGEMSLRCAVSRYLADIGLSCPPERILILSGSQQGIDLAAKLFVDPGTELLCESPTYLAALQVFQLFGATIHGVSLEHRTLDVSELTRVAKLSNAKLCYLNPTFQNPTGLSYDDVTRSSIAEALDETGVPLFEDDPYRELAFDGPAPTPIVSRLEHSSWIYQSSFSKVFMPGIRLGFLAASEDLFVPLLQLKQAADLHSNRVSQWLAQMSLESSERSVRLSALRNIYCQKRDTFEQLLQRELADIAEWSRPAGGLFFWLRLKAPRSLLELLPRALERGVLFVPGEVFFPSADPAPGYLRLNFSHARPEQMAEGLHRLSRLLRE